MTETIISAAAFKAVKMFERVVIPSAAEAEAEISTMIAAAAPEASPEAVIAATIEAMSRAVEAVS